MKKIPIMLVIITLSIAACKNAPEEDAKQPNNPLLCAFDNEFNLPPFEQIKNEHFMPAAIEAFAAHNKEIESIISNPEAPTFQNTIVALDLSGELLMNISNIFSNLNSAHTNDSIQKIAAEIAPIQSKHQDEILMNEKLFERIKAVYDKKDQLGLNTEDLMLLNETYKEFVRNGANLSPEKKEELKKINGELAVLEVKFEQNLLAETNAFQLFIEKEEELAGLPAGVRQAAAEAATEAGQTGKWLITLHKPSLIPFLTYSENREYREKMFKGYIERCNRNNEYDNKQVVNQMISLLIKKANLFDKQNYAQYALEDRMAKTPEMVYEFLNEVWIKALPKAKAELAVLQAKIKADGGKFKLEPWDWWFYAEKVRQEKYDLDEDMLRPYFELENVKNGMFDVANKLFGLKFIERTDLPTYHPEAKPYQVTEADGTHIGILYMDFYPRASKGGGAWMTEFRTQYKKNSQNVPPVIQMVMNFSKPTGDTPALLSFEEVTTMFHEFGHALHGLLSKVSYRKISGTNVPTDFVELPSQILENWAAQPEVMKSYAKHYKTGEIIPDELIQKLENSQYFNQGFTAVEYLSASFLDMDWHIATEIKNYDVLEFENAAMKRIGLLPEIVVRYRSPYFAHIFGGGYSAGYYSYLWAEVLDADAFDLFLEKGIFDSETAKSLRQNILEKGGSVDAMEMYKNFRGQEPSPAAMMKRKGLI